MKKKFSFLAGDYDSSVNLNSDAPEIGNTQSWGKPTEKQIKAKKEAEYEKILERLQEEKDWEENEDSPLEKRMMVIDGATLHCPYAQTEGVLKVTSNELKLQDRVWATEGDCSNMVNLQFQGLCNHPKWGDKKPPCMSVINLSSWKNVGTTIVQEQRVLVKESHIECNPTPNTTVAKPIPVVESILSPKNQEEDKKGGIHTRFYDEQGQQIYEIPSKLHKAFNEEYGIKIAYDKENEMLYHEGDCDPAYEKVSPTAIEHWKRELNPETISKGKLLFGYNFGYKIISNYSEWKEPIPNNTDKVSPVFLGDCPYIPSHMKHSMACIDLGDYDEELQPLGVSYKLALDDKRYDIYHLEKPKFSNRYMGLSRGLEHEFLGHVILNYFDDRKILPPGNKIKMKESENEILLGNKIRKEIGLPDRQSSHFYKDKKDDFIYQAYFGYYEGSDDSDPDIYVYPHAPEPAPTYPILEGSVKIKGVEVLNLAKNNYNIIIKYKYNEKVFDFI